MKALVYYERGKCEMRDVPEPKVDCLEDGITVRIDYCAMCATDVHIVTMGLYNWPTPWIMGHESMGTIVEMTGKAKDESDSSLATRSSSTARKVAASATNASAATISSAPNPSPPTPALPNSVW